MKIGLLSDTHSFIHPDILKYFKNCDEIWHSGDIGNLNSLKKLESNKKLRAVYGNIDNDLIRRETKEYLFFSIDSLKFLIIHIAGSPPNYNSKTKKLIKNYKPDILICGHSHILKIKKDNKNDLLYMNPGACGKVGFHNIKTIVRFEIENKKIKNLEAIELR
tara:strand:- start:165 stop:650 length:486 start_codon:yes stop_codon:yes gene_type:complete